MLCLQINKLKSPSLCVCDSIKVVLLFKKSLFPFLQRPRVKLLERRLSTEVLGCILTPPPLPQLSEALQRLKAMRVSYQASLGCGLF